MDLMDEQASMRAGPEGPAREDSQHLRMVLTYRLQ